MAAAGDPDCVKRKVSCSNSSFQSWQPSESGFQRTDLNPEVLIAGVRATELNYSGLAPGWLGLYQVNVRIPSGVPAGLQPLSLSIGGKQSNEVRVQLK
jgi:uncharacterized protein (TIGR03437 family)